MQDNASSPHPTPATAEPRLTCVVTGGTEGIGRAVCLELARGGHRVLFVGRDQERGRAVLRELTAVGAADARHDFVRADLSLLSETAALADELTQRLERIDAVVCCAGILSTVPEWTSEGLERNLVLNYLSRFLLVQRLRSRLQRSPRGRVVLVSNAGEYPDTLDFEDLQHRRGKPGLAVSGRTQFANDLFAVELADRARHSPLDVCCVHPGLTKTRVFRNARGLPWFVRWLAAVLQLFARSPADAARVPVELATGTPSQRRNGRFFGPKLAEIPVPPRAQRPERRRELWEASEALVRAHTGASAQGLQRSGDARERDTWSRFELRSEQRDA